MICLIVFWCLNATVGIALTAVLIGFRRRFSLAHWLRNSNSTQPSDSAEISVVIAARDEQATITGTVERLAAMPEVREILVVDDASTDETLDVIKTVAHRQPKVRVYSAPPLPPGWIGKSHALHWVSQYATGDYLLFTDADVDFDDVPLAAIIQRMRGDGIDHVGGMFRFRSTSSIEHILGSCYSVISFLALAIAAHVGSGAATGAFNLIARNTYISLNGHSSIRGRIMDDIALARAVVAGGHASQFLDMSSCVSVRLFNGFSGFIRSVSRLTISFLPSRHAVIFGMLISVGVMVYLCTVLGVPLFQLVSNKGSELCLCALVTSYGLVALPFVNGRWLTETARLWSWGAPISLLIMSLIVIQSGVARLMGRRIVWRNRRYVHCSTGCDTTEGDS